MRPLPIPYTPLPPVPATAPKLAYEALEQGKNYWIVDDVLDNAEEIAERCFNQTQWEYGAPYQPESWPGMRFHGALLPAELAQIEAKVKALTGKDRLWTEQPPNGLRLDCNVAQLVGEKESTPHPHTDSRNLCRYACVIYLSPNPPPDSGTSFCRLRYPNGAIGGNIVLSPHNNLVDALQVKALPIQAWYEDLRVQNVFNRMILYKANLVHCASAYFGNELREKRLTTVFFWMTDD
ncbi:DUF6445 family protein [Undibacterium baiyunense]|uniref:DUF6445 family protein n=1 Tax=Undibacterium baiyunense TaxID=2828731 RepID=UPI001E61753F|nr:DUF6445 family protein [Undibacterium baiyunense]